MSAFVAELIGTFLMILLGCGVNANVALNKTYGNNSGWIVITTGWAFAVYMGVLISAPYSGAHLNPAVTIGLAVADTFSWGEVAPYITAQFIGAMIGAFFVWLLHKDHFDATKDGNAKRSVFCNAPAIPNIPLNLLNEVIGTFVLVFSVLYFSDTTITDPETMIGLGALGALPVAIFVWGIGLSLGGTTGYAINPARDLGPRIIHALVPIKDKGSNGWSYSWVPVVGPVLGGIIAAILFMYLH